MSRREGKMLYVGDASPKSIEAINNIKNICEENQQHLRVALDSSPVGFTILRAARDESSQVIDFEWLYLNPVASRIIGRDAEELIGRRVCQVLPDGWEPPGLFECFVQVVNTGESQDIVVASRRNGIDGWVHNIAAKLGDGVAVWLTDITDRKEEEGTRKELLRRLVRAQEDERRRVAREMHDQLGQRLSLMILRLGMLKNSCGEQDVLRAQIEAAEADARQLDRDVDSLVWELRPSALDDLGLQAAFTKQAQNWSKHFRIPVELHVSGLGEHRLEPEIETTLYRVAQEALNNIAKHARTTKVDIIFERRDEQVSLIIEDNGVGFDTNRGESGGLGIIGMRERAALVGGTVGIESRPGNGVTVFVRIPTPPVTNGGKLNE